MSTGHWNYRAFILPEGDGSYTYGICEVYYDEDGNPNSRTDPVPVIGENIGVILTMMKQALRKPYLNLDLTEARKELLP